jgi:hypothetical protein
VWRVRLLQAAAKRDLNRLAYRMLRVIRHSLLAAHSLSRHAGMRGLLAAAPSFAHPIPQTTVTPREDSFGLP